MKKSFAEEMADNFEKETEEFLKNIKEEDALLTGEQAKKLSEFIE